MIFAIRSIKYLLAKKVLHSLRAVLARYVLFLFYDCSFTLSLFTIPQTVHSNVPQTVASNVPQTVHSLYYAKMSRSNNPAQLAHHSH
jgi:hypothetical protein